MWKHKWNFLFVIQLFIPFEIEYSNFGIIRLLANGSKSSNDMENLSLSGNLFIYQINNSKLGFEFENIFHELLLFAWCFVWKYVKTIWRFKIWEQHMNYAEGKQINVSSIMVHFNKILSDKHFMASSLQISDERHTVAMWLCQHQEHGIDLSGIFILICSFNLCASVRVLYNPNKSSQR